jgi:hypothetical protein
MMTYRGAVKRGLIEVEGDVTLPEEARVNVIFEESVAIDNRASAMAL